MNRMKVLNLVYKVKKKAKFEENVAVAFLKWHIFLYKKFLNLFLAANM